MADRFFIDERAGIIAVRDREHPDFDPDRQGLHPDFGDVVWHETAKQVPTCCPTCEQETGWRWEFAEGAHGRAIKALSDARQKESRP